MKRLLALGSITLAAAVTLTACGGSEESAQGEEGVAESETVAETETTEAIQVEIEVDAPAFIPKDGADMRRIAGDLDKSLCLRYGGTAEEREVFDFGDAEKLKLRLLDENDDVIQSTLATPQPGNPAFKTTFEKNSLQWVQEIPKALSACSFTAEFDGTEPRDFYSIEAAIYAGTFDNSDDVAQVTFTHDELVDQGYTVNLKVTQSLD